jgi:hypothetical protein
LVMGDYRCRVEPFYLTDLIGQYYNMKSTTRKIVQESAKRFDHHSLLLRVTSSNSQNGFAAAVSMLLDPADECAGLLRALHGRLPGRVHVIVNVACGIDECEMR